MFLHQRSLFVAPDFHKHYGEKYLALFRRHATRVAGQIGLSSVNTSLWKILANPLTVGDAGSYLDGHRLNTTNTPQQYAWLVAMADFIEGRDHGLVLLAITPAKPHCRSSRRAAPFARGQPGRKTAAASHAA
ncbi:MAG: hypothetical protein GC129_03055 [Proteobacteria bacterium]|nr:hypothetical protein [Pseudomonadota bacterium]